MPSGRLCAGSPPTSPWYGAGANFTIPEDEEGEEKDGEEYLGTQLYVTNHSRPRQGTTVLDGDYIQFFVTKRRLRANVDRAEASFLTSDMRFESFATSESSPVFQVAAVIEEEEEGEDAQKFQLLHMNDSDIRYWLAVGTDGYLKLASDKELQQTPSRLRRTVFTTTHHPQQQPDFEMIFGDENYATAMAETTSGEESSSDDDEENKRRTRAVIVTVSEGDALAGSGLGKMTNNNVPKQSQYRHMTRPRQRTFLPPVNRRGRRPRVPWKRKSYCDDSESDNDSSAHSSTSSSYGGRAAWMIPTPQWWTWTILCVAMLIVLLYLVNRYYIRHIGGVARIYHKVLLASA